MTREVFGELEAYDDMSPHSAAMNMAVDEAMLEHALVPSIRFYRWQSPALSFGYFGRSAKVAIFQGQRDLVRRWTGGGIVFHGEDLTYAIVIPANDPAFNESSISIYERIHRALTQALNGIGKRAVLARAVDPGKSGKGDLQIAPALADRRSLEAAVSASGYDCFANPVRADVMIDGRKIAGAAQRRTRRGLLQQGSIQGVELTNGFTQRFAEALSANRTEHHLSNEMLIRTRELVQQKYGTESWLRKR
jgi:lipoate-protein ligase A